MSLNIERQSEAPVVPPIRRVIVGSAVRGPGASNGATYLDFLKPQTNGSTCTVYAKTSTRTSNVCLFKDELVEWCKAVIEVLEG